jgi:hypothetical protein
VSNKLKSVFVGCSLTRGDGFDDKERQLYTWPELLTRKFMMHSTNLSVSGASNHMIFMTAAEAIRRKQHDIVFCQWTALNRLWLSPGPDTWYYTTGDGYSSFDYRNIHLGLRDKTELENKILLLNHDYQNIVDLIDYVNILNDLADAHKIKLVHVNGMVPWQTDLVNLEVVDNLESLSDYTKEILDFDNRADEQLQQYVIKLQSKFSTMDQTRWVNLFDSFQQNTIDVASQGHHPGVHSHQRMAEKIDNYLTQGHI